MLLPSRSAPISRSRMAIRPDTTSASRLPCFDRRNMLAREAPVSAVSLAAKNADIPNSATTMENVIQFMTSSLLGRELRLKKPTHSRRLDVLCNHRTTDSLQQDESQAAAAHLLVLRHQRHQRIGIGEPFLRKPRDLVQM